MSVWPALQRRLSIETQGDVVLTADLTAHSTCAAARSTHLLTPLRVLGKPAGETAEFEAGVRPHFCQPSARSDASQRIRSRKELHQCEFSSACY